MKYFLRPYPKFRINLGIVALAAASAAVAFAPRVAHAQAQEMAPMLADPSPFAVRASAAAGYLGVDVEDVDNDKAQALKLKDVRGALITLIDHDAPAGQIGLKVNDVVLAINGENVEGAEQLRRILKEIPPGRKVSLEISREGNIQTLAVQLADRKEVEHEAWDKIGVSADALQPPPPPGMGIFAGSGDAPVSSGFHMSLFTSSLNVGAMVEPLTSQMADYLGVQGGLMVKQVARKSEAAASGLKAFDVILKVGADSIATAADWDRSLRSNQGKPVQVTILRDKKQQTLTLQVDSKHRGALEQQDIFVTSEDDLMAEVLPFVDTDIARALAAQAFYDSDDDDSIDVGPELATQLSQQGQILRESMKNLTIDPQQMEQLRKQVEEIQNDFGPEQMKQLQMQIEKFRQQIQQCQRQDDGHFV